MRRSHLALCFVVFCSTLFSLPLHAQSFKVGLSNVDITPMNDSYELQGYGISRLAVPGKYDDTAHAAYSGSGKLGLSARAIYIAQADGSQPFVLVSVDVACLCAADTDAVRTASYSVPISRNRIIVSATHAHSAPASCDAAVNIQIDGFQVTAAPGSAWRTFLVDKMKLAVQQAIDNAALSNIRFRRTRGAWDIAYARRPNGGNFGFPMTADNGIDLRDLRPYTDVTGNDQTLDVAEITNGSGTRRGVVVFWAAHPVALGPGPLPDGNQHYHPDYPGFARSYIEANSPSGTVAIFVQANGADVNGLIDGMNYDNALRTGEAVGNMVKQVLNGTWEPHVADEVLAPGTADSTFDQLVPLSLQTAAGASFLGGTPGEPQVLERPNMGAPAPAPGQFASGLWLRWANIYCNGYNGHGGGNPLCGANPIKTPYPTTLDAEVQTVSIGNWRIAALSHEVVGLWGVELRQNWPAQHVTVVGYANRVNDYLPTADMINDDENKLCDSNYNEGRCYQFMYGLPAPLATYKTTNRQFDMATELQDRLRNARRTNYALAANGGVASASSEYSAPPTYPAGSFAITGINDGDRRGVKWTQGGGWRSNTVATTPTFQPAEWASVAFPGLRTIREIDVFTLQDEQFAPSEPTPAMTCSLYCINDYDVQYKDSSTSQWVTIPGGQVNASSNVWKRFVFAPITTQEVRVSVRWGQASAARIVEVEAWDYPERTNVARQSGVVVTALNDTPSANDEFAAQGWTFAPQSVVNGNRRGDNWLHDGGWRSHTKTDWTTPAILAIALGGVRTIDEIDVFTVQDATSGCGAMKDPSITDWFDGYIPPVDCRGLGAGIVDFSVLYRNPTTQEWITVKDVTSNGRVWTRFVFAPVETDAIRIVVNKVLRDAARIVQVETWGW